MTELDNKPVSGETETDKLSALESLVFVMKRMSFSEAYRIRDQTGLSWEQLAESIRETEGRGERFRYEGGDSDIKELPYVEQLDAISAPELQKECFPKARFLIEGVLPEGITLLTAASKIGKSWMALDMGLSIAAGEPFMGYQTNPRGVFYLALEDSYSRLQKRINGILNGRPAPPQLYVTTKAPRLDDGLLDALDNHFKQYPDNRLLIIDTLQNIRGQSMLREAAYAQDYREMKTFKEFLDSRGVSAIIIHHNRKMKDEADPFNMISGTIAIMGAADTIWTITKERKAEEAILHITGRDVDQSDSVIKFDKGSLTWRRLGSVDLLEKQRARLEYNGNPTVRTIKKLLEQSPEHRWSGKAKDLMAAGQTIIHTQLAVNEQKLGHDIKNLEECLFYFDRIIHTVTKSGANDGKTHHFYCQDLSQFGDAAADAEAEPSE